MKKLLDFHCRYKSTTTAKYWIQKPKRKKENQSWAIVTWHKPIAPRYTLNLKASISLPTILHLIKLPIVFTTILTS